MLKYYICVIVMHLRHLCSASKPKCLVFTQVVMRVFNISEFCPPIIMFFKLSQLHINSYVFQLSFTFKSKNKSLSLNFQSKNKDSSEFLRVLLQYGRDWRGIYQFHFFRYEKRPYSSIIFVNDSIQAPKFHIEE